jgi:hypothetical protein
VGNPRTIELDILHWAECAEDCPGPVDKGSCRDWAVAHAAETGHQTSSVRRITETIGTSQDEAVIDRTPSGLGWPAEQAQGWTSGTGGADDDHA